MKKGKIGCLGIIAVIMVILAISLIGAEKTHEDKKPLKMGDTFKSDKFAITVLSKKITSSVSDSVGIGAYHPSGTFVVVRIKYKNIGDKAYTMDKSSFTLTANGKTYSPVTLPLQNSDIFLQTINPGIEKTGDLYFDVPKDVAKDKFILKLSDTFVSDTFNGQVELY